MSQAATSKPHAKRWLFWSLAVFFYFYEFFLRVSPTVMVSELMQSFQIEAAEVGILSSAYLYAYAFMQVPVGMMMDRFGARKLLSIASIICALGCGFYGFATLYWMTIVGRILMGLGSAFGFIGMVYICSHWFEKTKIATLIAIGNSFGMIGAIVAEGPLAVAVLRFGWRSPIIILGLIGLALAIFMFFIMRSDEGSHHEQRDQLKREKVNVLDNLKEVATNPQSWLIGIGTFLIYSTTTAFAGLWGIPFLQSAYGLAKDVASFAISTIFLGWIIGGPIIGKLSDKIRHRRLLLIIASIAGAGLMTLIVYTLNLNLWVLYILLFLVGFFSSAENLCYCLAIEHNPRKAKGVASAFVNFILFLGAACIPIIVGSLLDRVWTGTSAQGVPVYTPANFQFALIIFPITFVLAAVFFLFVKKSPYMHVLGSGEYYEDDPN